MLRPNLSPHRYSENDPPVAPRPAAGRSQNKNLSDRTSERTDVLGHVAPSRAGSPPSAPLTHVETGGPGRGPRRTRAGRVSKGPGARGSVRVSPAPRAVGTRRRPSVNPPRKDRLSHAPVKTTTTESGDDPRTDEDSVTADHCGGSAPESLR